MMNFKVPNFSPPDLTSNMTSHLASSFVERIENQVKEFSKTLKDDENYSIIVCLNNGNEIYANWFGYHNPYMIIIEGVNNNNDSLRLLIHMNTLQIILKKFKKEINTPRTIIGYQQNDK